MTPGRTTPLVRGADPTIEAVLEHEHAKDEEDADAWLRSLPRRERRWLFRQYGLAKGARRKGGGAR